MLELYFKYNRVLRRLRTGALGGDMDRIAAHLAEIGYKRSSAKLYQSAQPVQRFRGSPFVGDEDRPNFD